VIRLKPLHIPGRGGEKEREKKQEDQAEAHGKAFWFCGNVETGILTYNR